MTTKKYLMQIKQLNILIEQKTKERDALIYCNGISSIDYSKPCVRASPQDGAPFVKTTEKIALLEEQINSLIYEYVILKNKMIDQIQALQNPVYMQILFKKYVEFKQLETIAAEMHYSYDYIKHAHSYALLEFGNRVLKDNTQ